ncbi:MAG TPA: hypothetical protein VKR80_02765 [Candidatus Limnocylindria bacterium]|nr:hypothetical protein [Candidatus Limnocylindria bacterium]
MRLAAPPYRGEGPRALWHVSEDPTLSRFEPHRARTALTDEPLVWAIDTRHLPLYWFPRDCPRCTFWASDRTTDADVNAFLDGDRSARVHVIEVRWRERVASTELHLYRMPETTFTEDPATAGYWMSREPVDALERITIGDLVGRHAAAGIPLRTLANVWPLWDAVVASTLEFSGMRLRNAAARP